MEDVDTSSGPEGGIPRRALIRGGAVVAGLGLAGGLTRHDASAADGDNLVLGQVNSSQSGTHLRTGARGQAGLSVQGATNVGVLGTVGESSNDPNDAAVGAGVFGLHAGVLGTSGALPASDPNSPELGAGVFGFADDGIGVRGRSLSDVGVLGTAGSAASDPNEVTLGAGVFGFADDAVGVRGRSSNRTGVLGMTGSAVPAHDPNEAAIGAGVYGLSTVAGRPGMLAAHPGGGVGLEVLGRTVLSTAGRDTVAAGTSTKTVKSEAVLAGSVVLVTLNSDSGGGRLEYVAVSAGAFTVTLAKRVSSNVGFSYLVLN